MSGSRHRVSTLARQVPDVQKHPLLISGIVYRMAGDIDPVTVEIANWLLIRQSEL